MTSYELGTRANFNRTAPICWKVGNAIEGVSIWVRDEKAGNYVRIFEVAAEDYVQGEPQSWSSGNFESVETARAAASKAYRYINRKAGR